MDWTCNHRYRVYQYRSSSGNSSSIPSYFCLRKTAWFGLVLIARREPGCWRCQMPFLRRELRVEIDLSELGVREVLHCNVLLVALGDFQM
jgi:hypothetical protein